MSYANNGSNGNGGVTTAAPVTPTPHSDPIAIGASQQQQQHQQQQQRRRRSSSAWSANVPGLSPSTSPALSGSLSVLQTPTSISPNFPRPGGGPPSPKATTNGPLSYLLSSSPTFPTWSASSATNANSSAIAEEDDGGLNPSSGGSYFGGGGINNGKGGPGGPATSPMLMNRHFRTGSMSSPGGGGVGGAGGGAASQPGAERASGVMRRLSLSGALGRPNLGSLDTALRSPPAPLGGGNGLRSAAPPSPPPNSAVSPVAQQQQVPSLHRTASPAMRSPTPRRSATISGGSGPGSGGLKVARDPIKKRGVSPLGERMLKGHFDGFGL